MFNSFTEEELIAYWVFKILNTIEICHSFLNLISNDEIKDFKIGILEKISPDQIKQKGGCYCQPVTILHLKF